MQFRVSDDRLVASVTGPRGRGYTHRCTRSTYEAVARAIEEAGPAGVTLEPLAEALDAPYTQVNVALGFLKQQGCLATRPRRHYPASTFLFEDAMLEYHALAAAPPDD
ncbi:MAG: hypothetical protein JXA69_07675 [Phycisphaerae bacterium]|nr:hypothetical protein [Phycisphaerae bacterium]